MPAYNGHMGELAMLADEVGVSERTLRRALAQGTLKGSRPTPRRLHLSAAEKRYVRESWPLLAALRATMRTEQDVRFALLFGSAARGEDEPGSDVDLLVESRDDRLDELADLSLKLEAAVGRPIDIVRLEDATPQLLAAAVAEGRVLVDREHRWPELRARGVVSPADRPRKAEVARWRREIIELLEDFPRQYAALESAMAAFGEGFDLQRFKHAYETRTDMEAYNRVQAVERGLGRLQNYLADLAVTGARLGDLKPSRGRDGSEAERAFATLREAGVIDGALCQRLRRAQRARAMIEHSYVKVPAGNVHRAAELIHDSARDFIGPYRRWIGPFLDAL